MAQRSMEPDEKETRKKQVKEALSIAETVTRGVYIGELNDDKFYLVINEPELATAVREKLMERQIMTDVENRDISQDAVLYLKDDAPKVAEG